MKKLHSTAVTWGDVIIGQELSIQDRIGEVVAASRLDNRVTLQFGEEFQDFKIEELDNVGSSSNGLVYQIGDFITTFAMLENYMRNCFYELLSLSTIKNKVLYKSETSGVLIERMNKLVKIGMENDTERLKVWDGIYKTIKAGIDFRNRVIHGSMIVNADEGIKVQFMQPPEVLKIEPSQAKWHDLESIEKETNTIRLAFTELFCLFMFHGKIIKENLNQADEANLQGRFII